MSPEVEHTDVGAYALGLLEEEDRRAFAAHLTRCARCRRELEELSGMASVLSGLGPVEDDEEDTRRASGAAVAALRRKRAAERRSRYVMLAAGVAASVTLVAGGVVAGFLMDDGGSVSAAPTLGPDSMHSPAEALYRSGTPLTGVGESGISGGVVMEPKLWGTHAALELKGILGPLECELIAVSKTGERRVLTGWSVPRKGYGVPGSPDPLYVHGGTALKPEEIDRFEVVTTTGTTLLTVST
ncbi:anti-sigma factor family protein [Thermostaphylospora chromogena]|uniref:Putative zinc-finger n=1 Tax=Thermostaphylospora chromogena TaxID=35622 RepID=A0A1H1HWL9_9ACTN|nr:zf-HC2 domain-containing protein [Thermostaphylospora chromogena]SDR29835.1 Putative zinc-finger [Thermostaphylospora chromogena]